MSARRTIEEILNSDDSGSEFDGFSSQSDISDISVESDTSVSDVSDTDGSEQGEVETDEWTDTFTPITVHNFVGPSGPNLPDGFDTATATPLDYFLMLFSLDLIAAITRYTNSYAAWRMREANKEDPYWTDTNTDEIRAFIGMEVAMGIDQLPDARLYWSKNRLAGNPGIQEAMTSNRYMKLKQYFHVADRASEPARDSPDHDRLYKVRPILEHVTDSFLAHYTLGRDVAVDEGMVKYTGKLSFRQYMPAKPIKRGIKIWMACDSETAYLSRFKVYLGRTGGQTEHGLGFNVVTGLTDNLHGTFRRIFFDNFFTSLPLMQNLLEHQLYACGTVRVNRVGFPRELKKPQEVKNRGEFKVLQKGTSNLTATVWKDKRLVHHLSTFNKPEDEMPAQRRVGAAVLQLTQPSTVHSYNQYMGGVDQHDQLRLNYGVGRNSKKWWRYIFWFLVNCCIVNAWILYKLTSTRRHSKKRYSHLDFRLELATRLIAGHSGRKRRAAEMDQIPVVGAENIGGHILCKLDKPKGRCRYHLKHLGGVRKETYYGCSVCRVHLCRDGCHARFHNLG